MEQLTDKQVPQTEGMSSTTVSVPTAPIQSVREIPIVDSQSSTTNTIPSENGPRLPGPSFAELVDMGEFDLKGWDLDQTIEAHDLTQKEFGRTPPPSFNFGELGKNFLGLPDVSETITLPQPTTIGEDLSALGGAASSKLDEYLKASRSGDVEGTNKVIGEVLKTGVELLPFGIQAAEAGERFVDAGKYKDDSTLADQLSAFASGINDSIVRHPIIFALDAATMGGAGMAGKFAMKGIRGVSRATGLSAAIDRTAMGRIFYAPLAHMSISERRLYDEAANVIKSRGKSLTDFTPETQQMLIDYAKVGDETLQGEVVDKIIPKLDEVAANRKIVQEAQVAEDLAGASAKWRRPLHLMGEQPKTEIPVSLELTPDDYASVLRKSTNRRMRTLTHWENSLDTMLEAVYTTIFDDFRPLQRHIQDLERGGKVIDSELNAYEQFMRLTSRSSAALENFRDAYLFPVTRTLKERGLAFEDVDDFLLATQELSTNITKRGKKVHRGLTDEEATNIIKELKAKGVYDKIEEVAPLVYKMNEVKLAVLEGSGLFDAKTIAKWKEKFGDRYVPVKGFIDDQVAQSKSDNWLFQRLKPNTTQFSRPVKGRTSRPMSPFTQVVHDAEAAIVAAELNKAKQGFLGLVREYPNEDVWSIIKHTPMEQGGEVAAHINPETGRIPSWYNKMQTSTKHPKDAKGRLVHDVLVYENGQPIHIHVKSEQLGRALNGLDPTKLSAMLGQMGYLARFTDAMVKTVGKGTRLMAAGFTGYSPEFLLPNLARDIGEALVSTRIDDSYKMADEILKGAPKAWRDYYFKSPEAMGRLERYRKAGAETAFLGMPSLRDRALEIKRLIKHGDDSPRGFGRLLAAVEHLNKSVENTIRYSAFNYLIDVAKVDERIAARVAQNITVNFNRGGQLGRALGWYKIFFNASLQGADKAMKMFLSPKGQDFAAATMSAGFALAQMNRLMGGVDSDGIPYWDKISDDEKSRHLIFMTGRKGERVTIPMPYGLNAILHTGYTMSDIQTAVSQKAKGEMVTVRNSIPQMMVAAGKTWLNAFNPVGEELVSWTRLISPSIMGPVIDVAQNQTAEGLPVHTDREMSMSKAVKGSPLSQLGRLNTGEGYKTIAELVSRGGATLDNLIKGDLSIADKMQVPKSWIPGKKEAFTDVSPEELKTLTRGYGGGPIATGSKVATSGEFLLKAFGLMESVGKNEIAMRDVPLVSRFVRGGENDLAFANDTMERFDRAIDAITERTNNLEARLEKMPESVAKTFDEELMKLRTLEKAIEPTKTTMSRFTKLAEQFPEQKKFYQAQKLEAAKNFYYLYSQVLRTQ